MNIRSVFMTHLVEHTHVKVESLVHLVPGLQVLGIETVVLAVLGREVGGHCTGLVTNELPVLDAGDVVLGVESQVLGLHVLPRHQVHYLELVLETQHLRRHLHHPAGGGELHAVDLKDVTCLSI